MPRHLHIALYSGRMNLNRCFVSKNMFLLCNHFNNRKKKNYERNFYWKLFRIGNFMKRKRKEKGKQQILWQLFKSKFTQHKKNNRTHFRQIYKRKNQRDKKQNCNSLGNHNNSDLKNILNWNLSKLFIAMHEFYLAKSSLYTIIKWKLSMFWFDAYKY